MIKKMWTDKELKYLEKNINKKTYAQIAKKIRKTEHMVAYKIKKEGLKKVLIRRAELTNKKYGKLTAIKFLYVKNKKAIWQFQCECGKIIERLGATVVSGMTHSCGCSRQSKELLTIKNRAYSDLINGAKDRNIKCDLTLNGYVSIAELPCVYCGEFFIRKNRSTNAILKFNTVDRINNEKGYIKGNCQPTCLDCNMMKRNMSNLKFKKTYTKNY